MTIARILGAASLAALLMTSAVHAQKAAKPAAYNETPAKLVESTEGFDFERRDVMIPMRDGAQAAHRHPRARRAPGARRSC
jgi:hypothetical protein